MRAPDLHVHSTFSIIDGIGSPVSVAERAEILGWKAAALTEHGWMGSAPLFYKACREKGIKPILGCEMYVVPDVQEKGKRGQEGGKNFHLTVLALSKEGYENLVAWTTFASRRENYHYNPRISPDLMAEIAPHPLHHNVVLSGCLGSELCQSLLKAQGNGISSAADYIRAMKSLFPNFYIELQSHHHRKFMDNGWTEFEKLCVSEKILQKSLIELADATETPLVLTNDSHYQDSSQRTTHLAMRASAWRHRDDDHYGTTTEKLVLDFRQHYAYCTSHMQDMERLADRSELSRAQEAIDNAVAIAKESNVVLDVLDNFQYSVPFSGHDKPLKEIRRQCRVRLTELIDKHGISAGTRFEHELSAMGDFAHYLLLITDFQQYARRQGILTNTRGSAANSLVCYCLEIHDIDPMPVETGGYGLVFERFYNPSRKKLPDVDIDIEKDRFNDYMEYVKSRMVELEGEGQVVQICNLGTFANRAAFRFIADAAGIPKDYQDEVSKLLPQMIDSGMVDEDQDAYVAIEQQFPEVYDLVSGVFDAIKNVSQHACGWLFGTKDRPIEQWIPLCLIPSSGTLVTQYDMKALDDFGLVKGDFLRLKTLSVIKRTLRLMGKDMAYLDAIPNDDPETFQMLREGRTEGIFTLQGKSSRSGCIAMEVESVHDLIKLVAIYRPALTRPGFDKLYNEIRKGKRKAEFPCKLAEDILGPSNGLVIFQEQILELGYAIGMDHREVEEFLQAMKLAKGVGRGAKEAFEKIHPMYMRHALEFLTQGEADDLWALISKFQGYGFNKGHATSYGRLAYRASFLKCHGTREFYSALLDVYPEKLRYVAGARSDGFRFIGPSVNDSGMGFSLGRGDDEIRVGLTRIKGLGPAGIAEIVREQPFASMADFEARVSRRACNERARQALRSVGAFDCLGVRTDNDDATEFHYLGFTLHKPKAFKACKPLKSYVAPYVGNSGHEFLGIERGLDFAEGRTSVAKLFWIPPLEEKEIIERKASAWAMVKTTLLTAVDENGVPFHLMAGDDRPEEAGILRFLAKHGRGSVVCVQGRVKQPFLQDGPMGFQFYGVIGGRRNDPQFWMPGDTKEKIKKSALTHLCSQQNSASYNRRAA